MIAGKNVWPYQGFTLIELLVTIAVIVIMATIAVPNFQSLITSNRQAAEYNKVLTSFHFARSEAVKRREVVSVNIDNSSGKNIISVLDKGNKVIRLIDSNEMVDLDNATVEFSSLGRLEDCKDSAGLVSPCIISVGNIGIEINAAGNIGKAKQND